MRIHQLIPTTITEPLSTEELLSNELAEWRTSQQDCNSPKRLSRSAYSSCVSQGYRSHSSKGKGHTDGHGKYLKGHKAKSVAYGGDVKDYDGKN